MLIVYAHPNKDGHCGYFLQLIKDKLEQKGIDYDIYDLYKMNYNPVMKPEEHYSSGGKQISEENKSIQARIKAEDKFIFIYPVWWNNMPAILKGFFDRVFVSGFAFKYRIGIPVGLLKGKAVIFCSSGSPKLIANLYSGGRGFKLVSKDVLRFAGIKSKVYTVDRATRFNDRQKRKIERLVDKGICYLAY